jgi:hypothetical protein
MSKERNAERKAGRENKTEKLRTFAFQPTPCTPRNIYLFNDRVPNCNEAEPPLHSWLTIATNDQRDHRDRLDASMSISICGVTSLHHELARYILVVRLVSLR